MFNSSNNNPGSDARGRNDSNSNNNINRSGFQRRFSHNPSNTNNVNSGLGNSSSNNPYYNMRNPDLFRMQQDDSFSQKAQNQALTRTLSEHQQQRLLHIKTSEIEVQQIANNLNETLLIKRRLESIRMQQREANKIRAELQMTATAQQANGAKTIPSNCNNSILPTKQREDEMTKPDLSTLAETAVAIASANRNNNNNSGIIGIGNMIKMNGANTTNNNRIAELFGRQASSLPSTKRGSQSISNGGVRSSVTNNSTMDALRRDTKSTNQKLNKLKRSLDGIVEGNTSTNPTWLWNTSTVGNNLDNGANISIEQLRNKHRHLQLLRRNSLPSTLSGFDSTPSHKRQKVIEQRMKEIGGLGLGDAMEQMRQLDTSIKMRVQRKNNDPNLRQLASKMAKKARNSYTSSSFSSCSQEHRPSLALSVASAPAMTSNRTTHNALDSPVTRNDSTTRGGAGSLEDRASAIALNKLNQLGGGFPMPKFIANSAADRNKNNNIPKKITPDGNKSLADLAVSENLYASRKELDPQPQQIEHQLRYLEQIGGFPMPPLCRPYQRGVGSNSSNETAAMDRYRYNSSTNIGSHSRNNAISAHIKNAVNRKSTRAPPPPTLGQYKRIWRDIRVVAGDDPEVDERLRKEVFVRKLHRGEIFGKKDSNTITSNTNTNVQVQQRRLSGMSQSSDNSDSNDNNDAQIKTETGHDDSIVI